MSTVTALLCYCVCLVSMVFSGGIEGGKVKDEVVGQCHHQLFVFFLLDPISR